MKEIKEKLKLRKCLKCGKPWKTTAGKRICGKCTESNNKVFYNTVKSHVAEPKEY